MEEEIKKHISSKRNELISSLTAISLFLTSASYIINNDRMNNKTRLYQNEVYTYNDYYNTVNRHYEYLKDDEDENVLIIRKITPWIIDGVEARRKIKIYRIKNVTFDALVLKGNYEKLTNNIDYEEVNEYKYKNELRDYDKYEETYFEVIERKKNNDKYIEKIKPVSMDTILMLLSELIIYLFVLKINEGPLYENVLIDIYEINKYKNKIRKLEK